VIELYQYAAGRSIETVMHAVREEQAGQIVSDLRHPAVGREAESAYQQR
jgi:hypothetical protein